MKYLIMIHSNPEFLRVWNGLTEQQQLDFGRGHAALTEALADSGELVVSEGLPGPETAKRVSVREGRTITTDGPFAEVKEHLAGFHLVECADLDRAVEIAARVPDAEFGQVEVRPVLDLSFLDM